MDKDLKARFKDIEKQYLELKKQIDEDTQSESERENLSGNVTDFSDVVKLIKSSRENIGQIIGGY